MDSSQLELEFATKLAAYDASSGQLADGSALATGTGIWQIGRYRTLTTSLLT